MRFGSGPWILPCLKGIGVPALLQSFWYVPCLRFTNENGSLHIVNYLHLDFDPFVFIDCKTNDLKGITKEACFLLKRASGGCLVSTDISLRIRAYGLNFLFRKLDEFESDAELTLGASDDMTSATEINPLTWYVKKNPLVFYCTHTDGLILILCDKSDMWPFSDVHSNVIIVFHI